MSDSELDALKARVAELEDRELFLQEQAGNMAEELERTRADLLHDVGVVSRAGHEVELQLRARVAELSTEHLHLSNEVEALEEWNFWLSRTLRDMARRATGLRALKARVDLLTTALTELLDAVSDPAVMCFGTEITRARAVLAAGEEKPDA